VRLLCQDESRFGILPTTRRRITASGVKPIAQVDYHYHWFYLYGAVEPLTGEHFLLELPQLNADNFQIFLDQLSCANSESLNVMLLDNGRFHRANSLIIPQNIVLIFLPPYSPELNPIERFWQDIKQRLFDRTYPTLSQMQLRLTQILRQYENEVIQSLTSFSYFLHTANAL